jgi:hypothetical protein
MFGYKFWLQINLILNLRWSFSQNLQNLNSAAKILMFLLPPKKLAKRLTTLPNKGVFGCKTVRLNLNWKSGRKNAFFPNLSRVCGFIIARTCAIWSPHIEMESDLELRAPDWNDAKSSISEAVYGKVANILAYHSGVLRVVRGTSNFWGCADEITPNQRILNWIWGLQIATEHP